MGKPRGEELGCCCDVFSENYENYCVECVTEIMPETMWVVSMQEQLLPIYNLPLVSRY